MTTFKKIKEEVTQGSLFESISIEPIKTLMQHITRKNKKLVQASIEANRPLLNTQVHVTKRTSSNDALRADTINHYTLIPLHLALTCGEKDIALWLIEQGASVNESFLMHTNLGKKIELPSLYLAIQMADPEIIAKFLEAHPLYLSNNKNKCSFILEAFIATEDTSLSVQKSIIEILLKHGASVNLLTLNNIQINSEILKWLEVVEKYQKITDRNNKNTPLGEKIIMTLSNLVNKNENKNFLEKLETLIAKENNAQEIFNQFQNMYYRHKIFPSSEMAKLIKIITKFCLKLDDKEAFNNYIKKNPEVLNKEELKSNNISTSSTNTERSKTPAPSLPISERKHNANTNKQEYKKEHFAIIENDELFQEDEIRDGDPENILAQGLNSIFSTENKNTSSAEEKNTPKDSLVKSLQHTMLRPSSSQKSDVTKTAHQEQKFGDSLNFDFS